MTLLVSLDDFKAALVIEHDEQDDLLTLLIETASAAVIRYLKAQAAELLEIDSSGEIPSGVEIPGEIVQATIYLAAQFYREPDGDMQGAFERGYLPKPVTALLYPLRDPALQ